MIQVVQTRRGGTLRLLEVPEPAAVSGHVVVANRASVISAGTERMARELARKSLLGKARERPDQVRRVIEKIRQEGLRSTAAQVREQLEQPMPLGYSSAGVVLATGTGVEGLAPGDMVASNGPHAGVVLVPQHLCAGVPDGVPTEQAAFTVLGAIALHGMRLSQIVLGETVFVVGLGLVGQLSVAMARAGGARVLATDLDEQRCAVAREMGAHRASPDLDAGAVLDETRGLGADAVIVAAATDSDGPMTTATEGVRKKGRVVVVGAVGMNLSRRVLYMKEAEVVVSCSYGPGRYDARYEERGQDYPPAYVRWTEQRNMQAVVEAMADGRLDVSPLITHRVPVEKVADAYAMIESEGSDHLGIVIQYPEHDAAADKPAHRVDLRAPAHTEGLGVGCIGAGSFAGAVLLPAIRDFRDRVHLRALCSAGGLSATDKGERFGFERAVTKDSAVLDSDDVDAVFIATRHDLHAEQATRALRAGKHVYVEKPLAMTTGELDAIRQAAPDSEGPRPMLMVGFNRRFAPLAARLRAFFAEVRAPITVSIRFNAGAIPADHWTQDEAIGGGRIIGEACHAIDLASFLVGAPPTRVYAEAVGGGRAPEITQDQSFLLLRHANGSLSSIGYLAGGDRAFAKERVEVIGGGRVAVLEDFRTLTTVADGATRTHRSRAQDKGHKACVHAFLEALLQGSAAPIERPEIEAVSLASIMALRSIREGRPIDLAESDAAPVSG